MARKRQKHEAEWKESVRSKLASRETEKDLSESQKVCEQLDSQLVTMCLGVLFLYKQFLADHQGCRQPARAPGQTLSLIHI